MLADKNEVFGGEIRRMLAAERVKVGQGGDERSDLRERISLTRHPQIACLLQHERSVKRGMKAKRLKAALDENYLLKVLRL